jgi:hypothetical protein
MAVTLRSDMALSNGADGADGAAAAVVGLKGQGQTIDAVLGEACMHAGLLSRQVPEIWDPRTIW